MVDLMTTLSANNLIFNDDEQLFLRVMKGYAIHKLHWIHAHDFNFCKVYPYHTFLHVFKLVVGIFRHLTMQFKTIIDLLFFLFLLVCLPTLHLTFICTFFFHCVYNYK